MGDNKYVEMVSCSECGSEVVKSDYQDENFLRWKSIDTNEIMYICSKCFDEAEEKPVWISDLLPNKNLKTGCVVLAKLGETWLRAAVWQYDDDKRQCEAEFYDEEKGTENMSYDNIKLLFTFNWHGDETLLMHHFKTYTDYLKKFGDQTYIENVAVADNYIPRDLQQSLKKNLDEIAESPWRDFHPGSDGKVQNLVHPSLYCYVKGVSMLKNGTVENFQEDEQQASNSNFRKRYREQPRETNFFGRSNGVSKYQWLPSEFCVDEQGQVRIQNYINGLTPREEFSKLYKDLEKVFGYFVPILEKVIRELHEEYEYVSETTVDDEFQLKQCTLQVFVKAANFIIQPGQTHEGVWHIEGVSQEHIIATGIYYYEVSENMQDAGLAFRRGLTEGEEENIIMEYTHEYPPPYDSNTCEVELGSIDTIEGRCIVFPNSCQHKLLQLSNKSKSDNAIRKMLCFFVVDPDQKITSTADVNDQNWKVNKVNIAFELQKVAMRIIGEPLPEVVASKILQLSKVGFSLEEAKENRLALMRHRKFYKDEMNREIEREIDLCEH